MLNYILKRLALMLPTLLGVLTLTFVVIQFVPGGPIDQVLAEARAAKGGGGEGGGYSARRDVDAKQLAELKALYGFVGSSRVDLQACKLEYSIVSPK